MKTSVCNPYTINWVVITPFSNEFNRNYRSSLRDAGFKEIGCSGIYADHFNPQNANSVNRIKSQLDKLNKKLDSYKRKKALFSFVITDKQFGLMGTKKAEILAEKKGWIGLCIDNGTLAVTYNQMYANGGIAITGSQCSGRNGKNFKNEVVEHFYY